jgi:hypothetical protein
VAFLKSDLAAWFSIAFKNKKFHHEATKTKEDRAVAPTEPLTWRASLRRLRCFVASLLRCFVASLLRCFVASLLRCFVVLFACGLELRICRDSVRLGKSSRQHKSKANVECEFHFFKASTAMLLCFFWVAKIPEAFT